MARRSLLKASLAVRLVLSYLAVVLLCGCPPSHPAEDYSKLGNPRKEDFVIGVSDMVKVGVWKMTEVNTETRVRPDGNITVPLIGDVKAAGRTTAQLKAEIQQKLTNYVKDESITSTVTVAVTDVNSYSITVSGKVTRPGMFHLKSYVTVSEAIALAGGPTIYAAADETVVVRTWKSNPPRRIPIQYAQIQKGLAPEQDIVLYTGDTIVVP